MTANHEPETRAATTTPVSARTHRVHWFAGRLHEVLDELIGGEPAGTSEVRVATLSAAETAEALVELTTAAARLDALRVALLAHADVVEVAAEEAATSTGAWLRHTTRVTAGEAFGLVRLARRLDAAGDGSSAVESDGLFASTGAALAHGRVTTEQARVIVDAVDALPASIDAALRVKAEVHLLKAAARFDAKALRRLGKHLLAVVDPDGAEEALARQVAAEEAAAERKTMLTLFDDGKGTCHGEFRISSFHGAMLRTALEALASPKRPDPIGREVIDEAGVPVQRTTAELHGLALQELLERYPADRLPRAGGGLATVLVTIDAAQLENDLGVATLDTGGQLSAGALRRLACESGVIPQVLGGASQVLDQGRRRRLFTSAQHVAMRARDKTCTAAGCTIPAAWCHAHHRTPWSRGGKTDVSDGRMLCPRHHTLIHHPAYQAHDLPDGRVRIVKATVRRS